MQKIQILRTFITIFWLGFFMAISFLETPLRFRAPGIALEEGEAIGRIVSVALNKCEWIFFLILLATWFLNRPALFVSVLVFVAGGILILETMWILPMLDLNAEELIQGYTPSSKNFQLLHFLLEIIKVPVLFLIAWKSSWRRLLFT